MDERRGVVVFFLCVLLSIIILLQISLMLKSDRFYQGLNRLDESFKNSISGSRIHKVAKSFDDKE